jgi:pimeloyl-ACP methyl ester carboxylesterase
MGGRELKRALFPVVAAVIALAAGAVPASATAAAGPAVPSGTVHVRVHGYSVTVDCTGAGTPTVILFSGFGDSHTIWKYIQGHLARRTRVCSYDRLGEGTSSAPRRTQTLASNARLLHDVLAKLDVHAPLVLVGHSIGGDIAANYARTYPGSVSGLVLFDATPVGYLQHVLRLIPPSAQGLAKALRAEAATINSGHNRERLMVTTDNWAPPGALGHTPVDVVEHGQDIFATAGKYARPLQNQWAKGQLGLAKLSHRSQVIIATRSGHYIYLDQPRLALDVINAVIAES